MKKRIIPISILIIVLLVAGAIYSMIRQPNPQEMVTLGLQNIHSADSFRYSLVQNQWVDGETRLLSRIAGEKSGENIRVQGQLAGSDVEMIKVGNALYNKDPFSKEWVKFENISVVQEVFLVELNPLSTLQLKEMGEVVPKEEEEVNGQKCRVYVLKPSVQNLMMERFWSDFEYTLYIGKSNKTIMKTEVKAKNKQTEESMTITMEFTDIGRKISIQPPEIAE